MLRVQSMSGTRSLSVGLIVDLFDRTVTEYFIRVFPVENMATSAGVMSIIVNFS